jgi:hypothetical protein
MALEGFLKGYSDDLSSRSGSVIKDIKQRIWVTFENYKNMYEKVYKTMVKAGIKKEVKEAIQHENVLSSKYILTYPGYLLFIDEKGTPISLMVAKWEGSSTSCQKMLVMLQYQQEPQQTFTLPC